jgi:hypothetical protein
MSVVKSNQSVATRTMQRQRVVQPMRPLGGRNYPADREPNPVLTLRIDHEYLAIEFQQYLYARIPIVPFHRHKVIIY